MKRLIACLTLLSVPAFAADPAAPAAASAPASVVTPLAVGAPAPELSAKDETGKEINLKDVYAKGPTLVYFYPKADTGGCTAQGCSIRDSWADFGTKKLQVVGVSGDTVEAQKAFKDKNHFPFPLLSDKDGKVAAAFGVPAMKPGIYSRMSFLVKDGKIAWTMTKGTTTKTHAADVLKAVEGLK